jgi:hypothetical protein
MTTEPIRNHSSRVDAAAGAGARAGDGTATFRVPDPAHQLAGLRLRLDVPGDALDFRRSGDGWELVIGRPPVSRMEYLVELRPPGGLRTEAPVTGFLATQALAFRPRLVTRSALLCVLLDDRQWRTTGCGEVGGGNKCLCGVRTRYRTFPNTSAR